MCELWESGFTWKFVFLISGCFLSVTILYHTLSDSSIRKTANVEKKDLYILQIDKCITLWYNRYVGCVYVPPLYAQYSSIYSKNPCRSRQGLFAYIVSGTLTLNIVRMLQITLRTARHRAMRPCCTAPSASRMRQEL